MRGCLVTRRRNCCRLLALSTARKGHTAKICMALNFQVLIYPGANFIGSL